MRYIATLLFCVHAQAAVTFFSGNLADPNAVLTTTITESAPFELIVQTLSYGGGTSQTGAIVPAGGFDPVISVFAGTGPAAPLVAFSNQGTCPPGNPDPATGACLDSMLDLTGLAAGTYTIAFTAYANFPVGPTLADGFTNEGSFTDVFGSQRTPNLAADLSTILGTEVPEPSYAVFGLATLTLLGAFRKRPAGGRPPR